MVARNDPLQLGIGCTDGPFDVDRLVEGGYHHPEPRAHRRNGSGGQFRGAVESTGKSDLPELERRVVSTLQRAAAAERAPAGLRARIEADRPRAAAVARRRMAAYGLTLAGSMAAAVVLIVLLLPGGTPGGPSVSEAATI